MVLLLCLVIAGIIQNQVVGEIPNNNNKEKRSGGHHWSYQATDKWVEGYPECAGKFQSPIKIDRPHTKLANLDRIKFSGYDKIRYGMTLTNNGHSAQLQLSEEDKNIPCIESGGLGAKYCFVQLHFHWGLKNNEGTEHILDRNYGRILEIHFVHTNPNEKKNGNAGIAVLGFLFQGIDKKNGDYEPLTKGLEKIKYKGQKTTLDNFALGDLLPDSIQKHSFFRYNGSLTTPPCTEGVIWTVFNTILQIGNQQMAAFRALYQTSEGENPKLMAPNFRPIQLLNGRTVYQSAQ